jgi:hypothetical protein
MPDRRDDILLDLNTLIVAIDTFTRTTSSLGLVVMDTPHLDVAVRHLSGARTEVEMRIAHIRGDTLP